MSDSKRGRSAARGPQAGQPRLAVDWVPTAELVPYAGNAKQHPDGQVDEICESIKEFGFSDPVGAWHDQDGSPIIVEGHGRVLAAQRLGLATVPVVWLDHLDDEGRRASRATNAGGPASRSPASSTGCRANPQPGTA
ncbi:MAG: ParB/Srx family N-terminal domain-containing protein [Parafannyhessea sp.]|uniref:ParB/Srx family N-terminal domain-containing protein n=1 Tax=Parafannyhessea sp. TaxID=2847324 RepID=UPI003F01A3C9